MLAKNHRLVLDIIRESGLGTHRRASDIFLETKRRRPGIGNTTVYRALARLRDLGYVREVCLPGGESATYEPMGPAHAHFHCRSCDAIVDVDYRLPERVVRSLARQQRLAIATQTVTFEGSCARCQQGGQA